MPSVFRDMLKRQSRHKKSTGFIISYIADSKKEAYTISQKAIDAGATLIKEMLMCRIIRTLFNFKPPATKDEIQAASLQFVRKVSGFTKPSKANEAAFLAAVDQIAAITGNLLNSLETNAPPKDRAKEAARARARAAQRFST